MSIFRDAKNRDTLDAARKQKKEEKKRQESNSCNKTENSISQILNADIMNECEVMKIKA